jgi:hypothetical protein
MVSSIIKPGVKNFDEVKGQIQVLVLKEKKLEKALSMAKEIKTKIGDNGDPNIAKSVWASAKVDSTAEFTNTGTVPGIGREFAFSEYVFKGDLNKWSNPIKGTLGAFLIKVNYRTKFNQATYEVEKPILKKQLLQNKKNRYYSLWLQNLKKESDVVDERYLFFR